MSVISSASRSDLRSATSDPYIVVSTDTHVGPSMRNDLRPYCEQDLLDAYDAHVDNYEAMRAAMKRGWDIPESNMKNILRANQVKGAFDSDARLQDMDDEGVAAEVIFHGHSNGEGIPFAGNGLVERADPDPALYTAGCRIYNRWLADFCALAPERRVGLAQLPFPHLDLVVEELARAKESGLNGCNFPAPVRERPSYNDPVYEPFWSACEDLDMSLNTHTGGGDRFPVTMGAELLAFDQIENVWLSRRAVWQLIFAGVFERHPNLKLVLAEQAALWIPELLRDMDAVFYSPTNEAIRKRLTRLPSEYWQTNCFVAASFMSRDEAKLLEQPGGDRINVMWGSDYPHAEGTYPYSRLSLQATCHGIDSTLLRGPLGETAIAVYGLDGAALREVAARIGPSVVELASPPERIPEPPEYTGYGFRTRGLWS